MTNETKHDTGGPLALRLTEGLGPLVERLLKYSDIRRNDPRENRDALRDLIVSEMADELQAVRGTERERCAKKLDAPRADILLACGELSAQEWRTIFAVLQWMQGRIRGA